MLDDQTRANIAKALEGRKVFRCHVSLEVDVTSVAKDRKEACFLVRDALEDMLAGPDIWAVEMTDIRKQPLLFEDPDEGVYVDSSCPDIEVGDLKDYLEEQAKALTDK